WLQGEVLEEQLSYWRRQLAGAPPTLELPCDRPRALRRSYRGTTLGLRLTPELSAGLRALSSEHGCTLFVTLLTGFAILLGRTSGQSDVVVGSPVANRQRTELEGLIGFLLNTLALRLDLAGDSPDRPFTELLGGVREVALQAFAHQDLPFAKLVEALQPERDLGQTPFYQVMFVLQNAPSVSFRIPGLVIEALDNEDQPEDLDFSFFFFPEKEGLIGRLKYSVELYDGTTIRRLLRHFRILLEGMVASPERRLWDLNLLAAAERQQLLAEWNDGGRPWTAAALIHQLVEAQVTATPEAVAVVGRGFGVPLERLSYRRLNRRANRLAHHLRTLGVGPEVAVGIYMERSAEMVVAILAALKAGGACLPLDPRYPAPRLAFMLDDAQVRVVLTEQRLVATLPEGDAQAVCPDRDRQALAGASPENPPPLATSRNLAYLVFTSGSTGRAKGVAVTHRSTVAMLEWSRQVYSPPELAGVLASTSICFDISVFELFVPLIRGGTV
ncbi:MAG: AMP-binding protein, partial [bacterium]|nr:AMP-binding protein [bacterium]